MTQKLDALNLFKFSQDHMDALLSHAAACGAADRAALLLEAGADPRHSQSAPLLRAASNGHCALVEMLLAAGCPKEAASRAFILAARHGHLECLRILAPESDIAANSSSALLSAAEGGHAECSAFIFKETPALGRLPGILDVAIMLDQASVVHALLLADRSGPLRVFQELPQKSARAAKRGHVSCANVLASFHELDQAAIVERLIPPKSARP